MMSDIPHDLIIQPCKQISELPEGFSFLFILFSFGLKSDCYKKVIFSTHSFNLQFV